MIRLPFAGLPVAVALAGASATAAASAAELLVEAPLATQVVLVDPAELASSDRLAVIEDRLSEAARAVCTEQYRTDTSYHLRACYLGTFREALGQLRAIQERQLANRTGAGVRVAISIRRK